MGGLNGTGDFSDDYIGSDGTDDVTLTLADETIEGAGAVGNTHLTLDVGAGSVIDADISTLSAITASLILNTESNTIENAGTLETTNLADLDIDSPVDNTGTILASGQGNLVLYAPVTGPGAVDIGANSFLDINGPAPYRGTSILPAGVLSCSWCRA